MFAKREDADGTKIGGRPVDTVHQRRDGDGEEEGEEADRNIYSCWMPPSTKKKLFGCECMTLNGGVDQEEDVTRGCKMWPFWSE